MDRIQRVFEKEGSKFPGTTYAQVVLAPAFENAKRMFLEPMLEIHRAHLVMLVEQSLLPKEEAIAILDAIKKLDIESILQTNYDGQFEDLFFLIEHELMQTAGEVAGSLHIARSRNDMGVAMYRMTLRQYIIQTLQAAQFFQQSLLEVAEEHVDTIMLGYTHTQQAQPTTFAHYLLAVFDVVERDTRRFYEAFHTCNQSPLGAAALTTTGFPINRKRVADLLGFHGLVENSYDAIAGADYLSEAASAVKIALINLGRFAQDLLLWATQEFSAIRIADPYVQISSIMPQKRNPVSLEHIRALSSSGVGSADTVLQMIHNTPFGDINDTEDDLQPHLWKSFQIMDEVYQLSKVVIASLEVNKDILYKRTQESFATITELADSLTREVKLPFRTAHAIASKLVKLCIERQLKPSQMSNELLNEAAKQIIGKPLQLAEQFVALAMDPFQFIQKRSKPGGPAPKEVKRMIEARKIALKEKELKIEQILKRFTQCKISITEITNNWNQSSK